MVLFRLDSLQLNLPTSHSYLRFTTRETSISSIEANSSIIIAVTVDRVTGHRAKREKVTGLLAEYSASYICDGLRYVGAHLPVFTYTTSSTSPSVSPLLLTWNGGGGISEGELGGGPHIIQIAPVKLKNPTCESCVKSILDCLISANPWLEHLSKIFDRSKSQLL